jgi:DTW domain-containing protein YfiP
MSQFESASCPTCGKPPRVCVCALCEPQRTRARVLILQHPQEQDVVLGSAPLLTTALPKATLRVGLSWRSLAHALGEEDVRPASWAVLYPASLPRPLTPEEETAPCVLMDARGRAINPRSVRGIVVLDGSWSQAKALWWRNAWLLKLGRVILHPREPSIYGKLRKEPRRTYVSTLESVAETLTGLGEAPEVRVALRRVFRGMVQRARDARADALAAQR